ncbi:MAG: hypothetical protein JXA44_06715 [Methanospirillaceae archaeon]|nr:hypothetical protein [Methanospirillaceae archaeon]
MEGYLDNEAADNPVETDLVALESLAGVSGGFFRQEKRLLHKLISLV